MAKQTTSTPQGKSANQSTSSGARPAKPATAGGGSRSGGGSRGDIIARRAGTPSLVTFFQESRAELRKVTWPTREQTLNLTVAVIVMTVGLAIFLGVIDTSLDYLIKPLLGAK